MELGTPELIIILLLVLLLFGPGRLSKIGGELGQGIHAFRKGLSTDDHPARLNEDQPAEPKETAIPVTSSTDGDESKV